MFAGPNPCDDDVACWSVNEDGHWCPSCGELIARPEWLECGMHLPDECKTCGYPDIAAVAEFHCGPDDDEDEDVWMDDCGMRPDGYCSKAGSEECEWECPRARTETGRTKDGHDWCCVYHLEHDDCTCGASA